MWIDPVITPDEWIDQEDTVVVRLKWTGSSSRTGVSVTQYAYNVFTLRDGKVIRMREYSADSRNEALKAAGLCE
jgi:ketosteroid isomerase-like protein